MQALDTHRRFDEVSPLAGIESRVDDEEEESGSALGRRGRGGCLGFIVVRDGSHSSDLSQPRPKYQE